MSGNCLNVQYTADYLGLAYAWHPIDIMKGEAKTPDFLAINPAGQVPVLVLDDGSALAQSNAIIQYLAEGSDLLPDDPLAHARINEMLFWEQYSHEPYVAVCRFQMVYEGKPKDERDAWRVERGEAALDFMNARLASHTWMANDAYSIADIALLAYSRLAQEGGFDLASRSHLQDWITRCENRLGLDPA